MNRRDDQDDDRDLPWDPMWAYVLGDDIDDRDNHDDNTRQNTDTFSRGDEARDSGDATSGGTILKKLWKRMERDAPAPASSTLPSHSRSVDREGWIWEIDTSQFSLMSTGSESDRPRKSNDVSGDKKKWISSSTKKIRDSIGTVWKDTPSILSRKSS